MLSLMLDIYLSDSNRTDRIGMLTCLLSVVVRTYQLDVNVKKEMNVNIIRIFSPSKPGESKQAGTVTVTRDSPSAKRGSIESKMSRVYG